MKTFAESDLIRLRAGTMSFDAFARLHSRTVRSICDYYYRRFPQQSLDLSDLEQEALLEIWRAVDTWDPDRGIPISKFVGYRMGRRVRCEIERVQGWPKKSRGTKAPVFAELDQIPQFRLNVANLVLDCFPPGIEREIACGLVAGLSVDRVASTIWNERREEFGLTSEASTRKITKSLIGRFSDRSESLRV
jgi:hypothetical protein